jgi:hypothetical protein
MPNSTNKFKNKSIFICHASKHSALEGNFVRRIQMEKANENGEK